MWLALAPYPPRARRLRIAGGNDDGRSTQRVRLSLPLTPWLQDRLERHEIAFDRDATDVRHSRSCLTITGLVRVQEGVCWDGPLTQLTPEGALLHEYFVRPSDAFTLNIIQAFKLVEPVKIFCAQSRLGVPWDITRLLLGSKPHPQFMPLSGSTTACSFRDIERSVGGSLKGSASKIFAWPLVEPISNLALKGQWSELVGMGRWKDVVSALTFDFRTSLQDAGHEAFSTTDRLLPERLLYIADQLRDWAGMILSTHGDEDASELKGALAGAVQSLQGAAISLGANASSRASVSGDGHFKHSALVVVNALLLSRLVRDARHFKSVIQRAVGIAFPALSDQVQRLFDSDAVSLPSVSNVSRARVPLDAALCLMERIQRKEWVIRFGIADSSPQKRDDWLLSSWDEINAEDLIPTFRCVSTLARLDGLGCCVVSQDDGRSELRSLHSTVKKAIRRIFNLPYALGVGGTTLTHKVSGLVYTWAVVHGPEHLGDFLRSFHGFCADMGTELGAAEFKVEEPLALLPPWLQPAEPVVFDGLSGDEQPILFDGVEMDDLGEEASPRVVADTMEDTHEALASIQNLQPTSDEHVEALKVADEFVKSVARQALMPNAVTLPGSLHIINNILEEVSTQLKHWSSFFEKLQAFERLMTQGRKERFVQYCVKQSPARPHADSLLGANFGSLYLNRFGAVHQFCRKLKPWVPTLRLAWNEHFFVTGCMSDSLKRPEGTDFSPAFMSDVMKDNAFFAYLDMVLSWQGIVEALASWTEGCPCHGNALRDAGSAAARRKRLKEAYEEPSTCKMKGRRLPELIAGELHKTFQDLAASSLQQLCLHSQVYVPVTEWSKILDDFSIARAHIESVLRVKFDWLERLPWVLAALAHPNPDVARRFGLRAVQMYDAQTPDVQSLHHPRTLLFLSSRSALRPLLDQFLQGMPLHSLPYLEFHVGVFRFANIVERYIEASHSLVSRSPATNCSGPVVSLTRRLWQLQQDLQECPAKLALVVSCFEQTRHAAHLPHLLGLANHPVFHGCSAHKMPHYLVLKHMGKIMYGVDLHGRFADVGVVAQFHEKAKARQKRSDRNVVDATLGNAKRALSWSVVLRRAFLEHVRAVLEDDGEKHDSYFSLAREPRSLEALSIQDAMSVSPSLGAAGRESIVTADIEADAGQGQTASGITCFRVVKRRPGDWHVLPMSAAAGQRMGLQDIVVSMCPVGEASGSRLSVQAESREGDVVVMKDFFGLTIQELESELVRWKLKPDIHFHLPMMDHDGDPDAQAVLQALVLPQPTQRFSSGQKKILQDLKAKGLASSSESKNDLRFSLTALGQALLQTQRRLVEPQLVSEIQREGLALHDRNAYELLKLLEAGGWTWCKFPSSVAARCALRYAVDGGEKTFCSGLVPVNSYLACLLKADSLGRDHGITFIRHYVPAKCVGYYRALLDGDPERAETCLALRPAVEEDGVALPIELQAAERRQRVSGRMGVRAPPIADSVVEAEAEPVSQHHLAVDSDDGCGSDVEDLLGLLASDSSGTHSPMQNPSEAAAVECQAEDCEEDQRVVAPQVEPSNAEEPGPKRPRTAPAAKIITPGAARFVWGCFRFTPKHSAQSVQWEASCPFHRKNEKTGCKKLVSASRAGGSEGAIHRLKFWCIQASQHDRQRAHMFNVDMACALPTLAELDVAVQSLVAPSAPPPTDDDLDSRDGGRAPTQRGRAAKAKAAPRRLHQEGARTLRHRLQRALRPMRTALIKRMRGGRAAA